MKCPNCGSENVNVQLVTETQLKDKHHGCLWWLCVSWWWIPIKWFYFFWIALFAKIFIPKRQKLKQRHVAQCVCQDCGSYWDA